MKTNTITNPLHELVTRLTLDAMYRVYQDRNLKYINPVVIEELMGRIVKDHKYVPGIVCFDSLMRLLLQYRDFLLKCQEGA